MPEYVRFVVCRTMGWDYETYQHQPWEFIQQIVNFLEHEATATKIQLAQAEAERNLNKH